MFLATCFSRRRNEAAENRPASCYLDDCFSRIVSRGGSERQRNTFSYLSFCLLFVAQAGLSERQFQLSTTNFELTNSELPNSELPNSELRTNEL